MVQIKLNLKSGIGLLLIAAVIVTSGGGMIAALLTQSADQVQAQSVEIKEQKQYVSDINVHFKTFCVSVIIVTACW